MVSFDEKTHTYLGECNTQYISVTQLLKKHGITADYSAVDAEVLRKASERGTLIHKEISEWLKYRENGISEELDEFKTECEKRVYQPISSELIVYSDELKLAGTLDFIYEDFDGELILADFKTTCALDKYSVAWQLSLYNWLCGKVAKRLEAWHFTDNGLKVVPLEPIPDEEIDKLLQAEKQGEIYQKPITTVEQSTIEKMAELYGILEAVDERKKAIETEIDQIKKNIMAEFKRQNVKSFENDLFKITLVDKFTRETVDTKKLKESRPEIYEEFKKTTKVAENLKITIKEKAEEQK